ncbi:MAG: periplasmic heavy metal sensor [Pseudolabrys sp.]|nr:periplasmic heavy metal sensor [Pseudolabrys sp.]
MSAVEMAQVASRAAGSRWLLLGSLALNLFFIGIAVAMAIRIPAQPRWDPNVFVRVERLADSLPAADAALVRRAMAEHREAIAAAQDRYHAAREKIRAAFRQDPVDVTAIRSAMADTRAARQNFDQVIQGVFADLAPQLSSTARHRLADWRSKSPGHHS